MFNSIQDLKKSGADLLVKKQRQGPLGEVALDFDGPTQRFTEVGYNPAALDNPSESRYTTADVGKRFDERDQGGETF